jgi:hypothetical protein
MFKLLIGGIALGILYSLLVQHGSAAAAAALTIGGAVVATVILGLLHET